MNTINTIKLPPVLRSRKALIDAGVIAADEVLPIQQEGSTFTMAQELSWLDDSHFVVGRWDGSMSVFNFETSTYQGPLMTTVVNSPAQEGVQMIAYIAPKLFVSSNDLQSLILWCSPSGAWNEVNAIQRLDYSSSYGVANSGTAFASPDGSSLYLVVGHETGYLSIWGGSSSGFGFTLLNAVNLSNTKPVNPWNIHNIRGVSYVSQDASNSYVVTGSEDGNLTVVQIPTGKIMNAVLFNPQAQRGINSITYSNGKLMVANCSVGPSDKNLWYFSLNTSNWAITLIDSTNLVINTSAAQVFNFDVIWGTSKTIGPCWFASTQEG